MTPPNDPPRGGCPPPPESGAPATDRQGVVVLASGRGTNLQSLIDARDAGRLPAELRLLLCNVPGAQAVERARAAGIETRVIDHRRFASRADFDRALASAIDASRARWIVLAGFMRVLTPWFVQRYQGRIVNIHPSLLPRHPGLDTHRRALEAGDREHGATVHFVTEGVDEGPVVLQARVPVLEDDTPETLAGRVLEQEHRILPQVVGWLVAGRLELRDGIAWLDDRPASEHARLEDF